MVSGCCGVWLLLCVIVVVCGSCCVWMLLYGPGLGAPQTVPGLSRSLKSRGESDSEVSDLMESVNLTGCS